MSESTTLIASERHVGVAGKSPYVVGIDPESIVERKLIDAKLQEALAELEMKDREMEEFVCTVSHDLKAPLVTLGGMLGILKEELQREEVVNAGEIIDIAEDTVGEMCDTIADLLKLSQLGRVACELEPLSFNDLAQHVVGEHAAQLEAKGVTVEVVGQDATLLADRKRLLKLFDNIINNALKYACDGPDSQIVIGCETLDAEIRVFVRDNGPGIAEDDWERVFGLFQQLDASKDGSGVGLNIVRRIMEVHGGRAWVESEVGAGATFWLAFPSPLNQTVPR